MDFPVNDGPRYQRAHLSQTRRAHTPATHNIPLDMWANHASHGPEAGASLPLPVLASPQAPRTGMSTKRKLCYGLVAACLLGAAIGAAIVVIKATHKGNSILPTTPSSAPAAPTASAPSTVSPTNLANPALQALPLTGCPMGGYDVDVTMGGQTFKLLADSGSGVTAVAAQSCDACDVSPTYSGLQSGTYTGETTQGGYVSDGSWKGSIYRDTLSAGSTAHNATAPFAMTFAAMTDQTDFFTPVSCTVSDSQNNTRQGILGLGPSQGDTDNFIEKMASEAGLNKAYTAQLCDQGGSLWLGGYNPAAMVGAPQFVKTPASQPGNGITINSMGVGETEVGAVQDLGAMAVDTGTSVLFLPDNVHTNFMQALGANTLFQTLFPTLIDKPHNWAGAPAGFTRAQLDAQLPPLQLVVDNGSGGTVSLSIPATRSYLIPAPNNTDTVATVGSYFLGLSSGHSILGFGALRSLVVTFDVQNQRIGFASSSGCASDLV